jgi:tRNA modification GTPase
LIDGSEPLHAEDSMWLRELSEKKRILVRNKSDLPPQLELAAAGSPFVDISCATGGGLEDLKDAITAAVWSGHIDGESLQIMINSRHQEALRRGRAAEALRSGLTLELVAADLRGAVQAVGEIVGKTSTEDLLDSIFSQFCLGK